MNTRTSWGLTMFTPGGPVGGNSTQFDRTTVQCTRCVRLPVFFKLGIGDRHAKAFATSPWGSTTIVSSTCLVLQALTEDQRCFIQHTGTTTALLSQFWCDGCVLKGETMLVSHEVRQLFCVCRTPGGVSCQKMGWVSNHGAPTACS